MALALNNLQRVDMPLNKETKPINDIVINKNKYINKIYFMGNLCLLFFLNEFKIKILVFHVPLRKKGSKIEMNLMFFMIKKLKEKSF